MITHNQLIFVSLQGNILELSKSVNILLLLFSTFLVFFMQSGFALLEVGQVRAKNTANVAMKNLIDWSQGVIMYFLIGATVAYAIGNLTAPGGMVLTGAFTHFTDSAVLGEWLFGAVFAMTAATIVSGAVVGRIKFTTYVAFGVLIVAVIYPVVQGLTWQGLLTADGYLGQLVGTGYIDFAGGTVVHTTGGICGLVAAWMIGPRNIRYQQDRTNAIPGHSVFFSLLGAFILAFGWYGFNVGSYATVLTSSGSFEGTALAKVAVNTTLAMGAGTIAAALVTAWLRKKPDPLFSANGMVAGLVAITSGAAHVTWWGSLIIGACGGAVVMPVHRKVINEWQIDDAISVFPVHGVAGVIGVLLLPLFAVGSNGGWQILSLNQFAMQAIGVVIIAGWATGSSLIGLWSIKHLLGLDLRVSSEEEKVGLDASEHDIIAYPEFAQTVGMETESDDSDENSVDESSNHLPLTDDATKPTAPDRQANSKTTVWRGKETEIDTSSGSTDSSNPSTTTWRGQTVEISNRTEYERELQALTDRLELALEETDTGVWELDFETDEYVLDEASEQLLGYDPGTFPGTFDAFADQVPDEDMKKIQQEIDTALETGQDYRADFRVHLPDGNKRWLQSRGIVEYTEDGDPNRMIGIQTDITEHKEYERALEEQRDNLEMLNQVVRHDIRNNLNLIMSYSNMLNEDIDSEYLDIIRKQSEDAIDLTETARNLTDVMLGETNELREKDLEPVLNKQIDDLRSAYPEADITIITPGRLKVVADDMLPAVFRNLLKNAILHNDKEMPTVEVTAELQENTVYIKIADNGPGVKDSIKEDIFGKGEKGLESEGTGIGLYLVQTLVSRYGGDVWVEDNDPEGAIFCVELPSASN